MSSDRLKFEQVTVESHPEARIIRLEGILDSESQVVFQSGIDEVINAGAKVLIINGEKLNFISSAGFGILLGEHAKLEEQGGKIVLTNIKGTEVFETFSVLGYADMFEVFESEEEVVLDRN